MHRFFLTAICYGFILFRSFTAEAALATDSPYLACQFNSNEIHGGCAVRVAALATVQEDVMTFEVEYLFPCRGHRIGMGLSTESSFRAIPFATVPTKIRVDGLGPLRIDDEEPKTTYRATLAGDCRLQILGLKILPTLTTLDHWQRLARLQAAVLMKSIDLFFYARDTQNLSRWNHDRLVLMRDKLIDIQTRRPDLWTPQLAAFLDLVSATLAGQPNPSFPTQQPSQSDLVTILFDEVIKEGAIAKSMQERFQRYQLACEETLAVALERLRMSL